jgi:[ribosomal protein S18]-alanine N-acetyltransferase
VDTPFPLTLRAGRSADVLTLISLAVRANESSMGALTEFAGRAADIEAAFSRFLGSEIDDVLVAEHNGQPLGFSATEGHSSEISDLWVDPDHQGRGIGAFLLAACEARIRSWGHASAWLTTHAANTRAIGFYRTHGYALDSIAIAPSVSLPDASYPKARLEKQFSRPAASKAHSMADVRVGIDTLDPMLVSLLAERFAFIDRASQLKPALAMPARVPERVEEVITNAMQQAQAIGFDAALCENLWRTMVDLAIEREENAMKKAEP